MRDGRDNGRGVQKGDDGFLGVCADMWMFGGWVVDEPGSFDQLFVWEPPRQPAGATICSLNS